MRRPQAEKLKILGLYLCENLIHALCHCARIFEQSRGEKGVVVKLFENELCKVGARFAELVKVLYDVAFRGYFKLHDGSGHL